MSYLRRMNLSNKAKIITKGFTFIFVFLVVIAVISNAAEPWWHEYTPVANLSHGNDRYLETIKPGAAWGVGSLGWYGFWFLDIYEQNKKFTAVRENLRRKGIKYIIYYDLGEVGDFAGFFTNDGRLAYTGWSLPQWKGNELLNARWFGLEAFIRNVPWAPFPKAKTYNLKPFTTPDGKPPDDLYAVLTKRSIDGKWKFNYYSNPQITDEIAERSGLAKISTKQINRDDIQGKTGWITTRLVHLDFANPQLGEYVSREIERIILKLRPDGIHADNFGDNNLGYASGSAFGLWSIHTFREYLKKHFTPVELTKMGVANPETFDIATYINNKGWGLRDPRWATEPVWCVYRVHKVESALKYHRAFYNTIKTIAQRESLNIAVFGNTIPLPLGGSLIKGSCDIAHFEWSTFKDTWGMRPMGLPPEARMGYVVRLGTAISDAPFSWPRIYVSREKSGHGHENLHKVLAFDAFANHGLLDFGYWYLDGYSPGTPESAGFINRFISANASRLRNCRFAADIGLVHSAWSEIASMNLINPMMDQFVDEYIGWAQFLEDTHQQWDVVLQQDLTLENLARYKIVILPSVLVLTDNQINELRRYVSSGGQLIITGQTGTRYGPERFLFPREGKFVLKGARFTSDKPGVVYWRESRNVNAAKQMAKLLSWPGFHPRLTTSAPTTVGVNLNFCENSLLALVINNRDINVENDKIHTAPDFNTTMRLPNRLYNCKIRVTYVRPESPLDEIELPFKCNRGILQIKTPSFYTALLVYISPISK